MYRRKSMSRKRAPVRRRRVSAPKRVVRRTAASRVRVRRQVLRLAESKMATFYLEENLTYGNNANGSYNLLCLTPGDPTVDPYGVQISQGAGEGNRIGNQIRPVSCKFSGIMWPNPFSLTNNKNPMPLEVVMWIFSVKPGINISTQANFQGNVLQKFFQYGNAYQPVSGQIQDVMLPPNQDVITLYKKRVFKLGNDGYFNWDGNNTPNNPSNAFSNNDFKLNCKFSIDYTKYCPKVVKWNDNEVVPVSRGVYCLIVPYYSTGGVATDPTGVNSAPMRMNVNMVIKYKDM